MAKKLPNTNMSVGADLDGDATDAEINRKLTELLKANAVHSNRKLSPEVSDGPVQPSDGPYSARILKSGRLFLLRIAILPVVISFWMIAVIFFFFHERTADRQSRVMD